ncbi:MAG TPA: pilus assembly protein TadG-related protein [Chloroflexota bacterium]|nr:pilus assembly protein TadG-related protein [Chloroflexota bacterium]
MLVVFAITAASMLAVVGLLYTFGVVLAQRRSLQTAADAASLSGTWQIMQEWASDNRSDGAVLLAITRFATTNGLPSDGTTADATYLSAWYLDASGGLLPTPNGVGSVGTFIPAGARGVKVDVTNRVSQVTVKASASATARATQPPLTVSQVLPLAVNRLAYVQQVTYDLFADHPQPGGWPTLNLSGAAPSAANEQSWSDGQNPVAMTQPVDVTLADSAYFDSVVAGLRDNVRRQQLFDAANQPYALVTLPMYEPSMTTGTSVHIVGFAQMKIRAADIIGGASPSATGTFIPYALVAYGTLSIPTFDLGAALVGIVS